MFLESKVKMNRLSTTKWRWTVDCVADVVKVVIKVVKRWVGLEWSFKGNTVSLRVFVV